MLFELGDSADHAHWVTECCADDLMIHDAYWLLLVYWGGGGAVSVSAT